MFAYPRLESGTAVQLLLEYSEESPERLVALGSTTHPRSHYYPVATNRVSLDKLIQVQTLVRELARRFGHPRSRVTRSFASFDQELAGLLVEELEIIPADAADEGVWSFMSLVLLPDVAFWRFPNTHRRADYERILGKPRNAFRRLWWRAYSLGDKVSARLLEDEAVAIMERPTFGGDPKLASAIGRAHLAQVDADQTLPRTELMREATKRLRRLAPVVTLTALERSELDTLVHGAFAEAAAALESRGAPTRRA